MKNRYAFALCSIALIVCLSGCTKALPPQTRLAMGTVCTINIYEQGTEKLYAELFDCLQLLDEEFSTTNSSSEISHINAQAGIAPVVVTDDVRQIIQVSLAFARLTDGAFDPTVGPLVKLWGINTDDARVPSQQEIDTALSLVDYKKVDITENTVYLQEKGMRLDLGAIVKGYAADRLASIMTKRNVKRAIINLGGNIYVYGTKKDGSDWGVGVKNPDSPEGQPAIILQLPASSVVTSGVYERFFIQDGIRYHHILDPKTGYPVHNSLTSVSIVCASSTVADALSTSLFIMGKDAGFSLLERLKDRKALENIEKTDSIFVVDRDGIPIVNTIKGFDVPVSALFIDEFDEVYASPVLHNRLKINLPSYNLVSSQ